MNLGKTSPFLSKATKELSPLLLAYMGDAVYEVYVRYHLLALGIVRPQLIQKEAVQYVAATAQARGLRLLEPMLTEKELDVVRRGRNAKPGHTPKNTKVSEYRLSTGLEALIGYWYLNEEKERLDEMMHTLLQLMKEGETS
ncbi:Mini-ribonuclease 3 [Mechercharimyces sp. CAU 1602]|uniref:Mini-ribonuclease 3 n=1 Tax=Mechercharimyces sp. CAU 1602 TaxID=2973933 RepID=UPI0021615EB0|nr:ribonuclease III domain-containing protein [Mechercharimyces sp. CAU 1602]